MKKNKINKKISNKNIKPMMKYKYQKKLYRVHNMVYYVY